ncbi:MAG: hypothetical protein AAF974_00375 [Cyanobacteria bacterium P01_E01_bin.34]
MASFSASISVGVSVVLLLLVAGFIENSRPGGVASTDLEASFIGLAAVGLFVLDFIAFILGVMGLFQRDRNKTFPILGTVFSGLMLAGMLGIVMVGLYIN